MTTPGVYQVLLVAAIVLSAWPAAAQRWAYISPTLVGNNNWNGNVGMDFNVPAGEGVYVYQLGTYNNNANLPSATCITVGIFTRSTQALVPGAQLSLCGSNTQSDGIISYASLNPIVKLSPGQYSIVARGYSSQRFFEYFSSSSNSFGTGSYMYGEGCDLAGGAAAINFVGTSRYDSSSSFRFPTTLDGGPTARYGAGTFSFAPVSCPALWLAANTGVAGSAVGGVLHLATWASRAGAVGSVSRSMPSVQVTQRGSQRNFNPGVAFDGTATLDGNLAAAAPTPLVVAVFTGGVVPQRSSVLLTSGSMGVLFDGRTGADASVPCLTAGNVSTLRPSVVRVSYASAGSVAVHVNGLLQPQCAPIGVAALSTAAVRVGGGSASFFRGVVFELLVFPDAAAALSAAAVIESYVSLKYAVCLDNTVKYVDSQGGVVYNNTAPFDKSVTALGRDTQTQLDQRVGMESNCNDGVAAPSVLRVATTLDFERANTDSARTVPMAAGEHFVCGSDGGGASDFSRAWGSSANQPTSLFVGGEMQEVGARAQRTWRCDFVKPSTKMFVCFPRSVNEDTSGALVMLIDYRSSTFASPVGRASLEVYPLAFSAALGCWTNSTGFSVAPAAGTRGQMYMSVAKLKTITATSSSSQSGSYLASSASRSVSAPFTLSVSDSQAVSSTVSQSKTLSPEVASLSASPSASPSINRTASCPTASTSATSSASGSASRHLAVGCIEVAGDAAESSTSNASAALDGAHHPARNASAVVEMSAFTLMNATTREDNVTLLQANLSLQLTGNLRFAPAAGARCELVPAVALAGGFSGLVALDTNDSAPIQLPPVPAEVRRRCDNSVAQAAGSSTRNVAWAPAVLNRTLFGLELRLPFLHNEPGVSTSATSASGVLDVWRCVVNRGSGDSESPSSDGDVSATFSVQFSDGCVEPSESMPHGSIVVWDPSYLNSSTVFFHVVPDVQRVAPAVVGVSIQGVNTAQSVTSVVVAVLGDPVLATQANRLAVSVLLLVCALSTEPLPFYASPLGLSLGGDADMSYTTGAVVGNIVVVLLFCIAQAFVAVVYRVFTKTPATSVWNDALAFARFPSLAVFPVMFLQQPTIAASVTVLMYSTDVGLRVVGALGLIAAVSPFLLVNYYIRGAPSRSAVGASFACVYDQHFVAAAAAARGESAVTALNRLSIFFFGGGKWLDIDRALKFKQRCQFLFADYTDKCAYFLLAEMAMNFACGVAQGLIYPGMCKSLLFVTAAFVVLFLALAVWMRPFASQFQLCFTVCSCLLQLINLCLSLAAVQFGVTEAFEMAVQATIVSVYAILIQVAVGLWPKAERLRKIAKTLRMLKGIGAPFDVTSEVPPGCHSMLQVHGHDEKPGALLQSLCDATAAEAEMFHDVLQPADQTGQVIVDCAAGVEGKNRDGWDVEMTERFARGFQEGDAQGSSTEMCGQAAVADDAASKAGASQPTSEACEVPVAPSKLYTTFFVALDEDGDGDMVACVGPPPPSLPFFVDPNTPTYHSSEIEL